MVRRVVTAGVVTLAFSVACTGTIDAGSTRPHGLLPVDERNSIIVVNDGSTDNWGTEYALLLANGGGSPLAGIIIGTSGPWPELDTNAKGARDLVAAAVNSGLKNIPDPIGSIGAVLQRPASGDIDDTQANRSEGALAIVETSRRLALPYRPVVVVTGSRLTDVADAYLIDHSVVDRVFVVSSLGTLTASGASMGAPNGEMDTWADAIVTARFRYIQVSAFYDQLTDVPASRVSELPANPFGSWIAAKHSKIYSIQEAADQVAVAAVGIPQFVTEVERVSPPLPADGAANESLTLSDNPTGPGWLVRQVDGSAITQRFWSVLLNPATFAP